MVKIGKSGIVRMAKTRKSGIVSLHIDLYEEGFTVKSRLRTDEGGLALYFW